MTVGETTGGLPYVLRETFTTTGRKVNLKINPQWICIRVSSAPCKVYFTQDDFDNDENYVGINISSDLSPYGEWKSKITANYIWIRGFNGSSDVELVCTAGFIEDYNTDYASGSGGDTLPSSIATVTHSFTGNFTLLFKGPNGTVIYIDPGDGSGETPLTLLGSTEVTYQRTNDGTERTVQIRGDIATLTNLSFTSSSQNITSFNVSSLQSLTVFWCGDQAGITDISSVVRLTNLTILGLRNNPLTYIGYDWATPINAGTLYAISTLTTAGEVDLWLSDLNDAFWANWNIQLAGTNPAPTAGAALDIADLTLRGCTVQVN